MVKGLGVLVAAVALWALWWPVAAWREQAATERWLDTQRAAGWQAEAAGIRVSGFPMAYVRRIDAPALADPQAAWAWQADWVEIARARHPQISGRERVLTFPGTQQLQTPWHRLTIASERARITLTEAPGGDAIAAATAEVLALEIRSTDDWRTALARGTLSATADADRPERVHLLLSSEGLVPPARIARALSNADLAPDAIERLEAELEVTFDRPWNMAALQSRRPQPVRIVVEDAGVRWGDLILRVAGTLDVDPSGAPTGDLLVKATNWREILGAAVGSGIVPQGIAGAIEGALELASRIAGSPATLDIPVSFSNGRTRLGPVPVGPAPLLRLP